MTYTITASNAGPSNATGRDGRGHLPGVAHLHLDLRRRRRRHLHGVGLGQHQRHRQPAGRRQRHLHRELHDLRRGDRLAEQHGDGRGARRRDRSERRATTRRRTPTRSVPSADLAITKTDGVTTVTAGRLGDLHDHREQRRPEQCNRARPWRTPSRASLTVHLDLRRRRRRHLHGVGLGQHQRHRQPAERRQRHLHRELHDLRARRPAR